VNDDRCQFSTTQPRGALSQSARRGSPTRYRRCRNKATTEITYTVVHLAHTGERTVRCCGLHARLHREQGWLP
jgi:hypothetical protein